MKDGFIKVAAATTRVKVACPDENADEIIKKLRELSRAGVKLAAFPELCITAYTCADLFFQEQLLCDGYDALEKIIAASKNVDMVFAVGLPVKFANKLYNAAAVVCRGRLLGVVPKTNIPNYGEFYESRHFESAPEENSFIKIGEHTAPFGTKLIFICEQADNLRIAVEICEDLWVPVPPSCAHAAAGASVILNLSASDELVGKDAYRKKLVTSLSARLICGYIFADAGAGESTTDLVYSANNLVCENGIIISENKPFDEKGVAISELDVDKLIAERRKFSTYSKYKCDGYEEIYFDLEKKQTKLTRKFNARPFVPDDNMTRSERCEQILSIQSHGLATRMTAAKSKRLVLGISGGLDSCLALLVCARACDLLSRPRTDILALTMPCFGTTARTKGNAEKLSQKLGVDFKTIDIKSAVDIHFADIGQNPKKLDVTYENSQSRERTQILMDIANKENGLVVGTGDLSELALGFATYNGDHMSMYGVNASVPKTLVRHIVAYAADEYEKQGDKKIALVLRDILETPVSPELLPPDGKAIAQKTEQIIGPYEIHDFYLYNMVRFGFAPEKLFRMAKCAFAGVYDDAELAARLTMFVRRFITQQFKRSCLPDGPKVGSVSLSPRSDFRMPSDASPDAWLKRAEAIEKSIKKTK